MNDRNSSGVRFRQLAVHLTRAVIFAAIIALIHLQHTKLKARRVSPLAEVELKTLRQLFPSAQAAASETDGQGRREVLDEAGERLGYILQTSPGSDHIIGFSGPTNTLLAFDLMDNIVGLQILESGDTRDHVARIRKNREFLTAFNGLTRESVSSANIDSVSGATLTSMAIQEAIVHRLSGQSRSLRFPAELTVDDAHSLFPAAKSAEPDTKSASLWHIRDQQGRPLGTILRTTPAADKIIGYQGPSETLIGISTDGKIVGITVAKTYDNDKYVTYVREDEYFLSLFNELTISKLAVLDLEEAEVEGVSGATMTSMAIADGLIAAAQAHQLALKTEEPPSTPFLKWTVRDAGSAAVIAGGLLLALTRLRGNKSVRVAFQLVLIVYLGLLNGDLLSQAMFVGWAQAGVPWTKAGGLAMLAVAALIVPLTTRRNVYCSHLCPHGAAQHLLKNRVRWRMRLSRRLSRALKFIPAILLVWCVVVAMTSIGFSLVDIEPFDAWVFRVAGWATITIAIVGLVASLFVPMAYCRFGCPTGAVLSFLRFNGRSDLWSRRDWLALGLLGLAAALHFAT